MPEFALHIDKAALDMLAIQEINEENGRHYYLLAGNPAVRVTVRGAAIEDLVDQNIAVLAGFEECWGQWQANAHLRGRKSYTVTVFGKDAQGKAPETFSAWLQRNYIDDDAPYREAGDVYSTAEHDPKE